MQIPQLEAEYFFSQLFWTLFTYFVLFFLVRTVFLPSLDSVSLKRSFFTDKLVSKSKEILLKAKEIEVDYNRRVSNMRKESEGILDNIRVVNQDSYSIEKEKVYKDFVVQLHQVEIQLKNSIIRSKGKCSDFSEALSDAIVKDIL